MEMEADILVETLIPLEQEELVSLGAVIQTTAAGTAEIPVITAALHLAEAELSAVEILAEAIVVAAVVEAAIQKAAAAAVING
jgi:site-specific recombinase